MRPILMISAMFFILAGCGTPLYNDMNDIESVEARHPISIDQQTVSLVIDVDPTSTGLNRVQLKELDALVTSYRRRGHGPITVTAPIGTRADIEGAQTAAEIRAALNSFGIDYRDLQGATYRADENSDKVLVSFISYVASAPECGLFHKELSSRMTNKPHPNFGCAQQHNLAAMISDPRDLARMQRPSPIDGASAAHPVRAARAPEGSVNEIGVIVAETGE